jgi:ribonucleoside-triphosphate reductase (thioredoxin)
MDRYSNFIHLSRYSRFIDGKGRRETWTETVDRVISFWEKRYSTVISQNTFKELRQGILDLDYLPSMRSLWSAGPALEQNNFRGYNCSYIAVDTPRAFDEALFILMAGTGLGFSVEKKFVSKLPIVNDYFESSGRIIEIEDSAEGWAKALRKHIADLYLGRVHKFDPSKVRREGARLKTMGGRSSGPEPFMQLLAFVEKVFRGAAGRKLTPLECHEIMCFIGNIVVVGGVRRSALISLSDLTDDSIRDAKSIYNVESLLLLKENETTKTYSVTCKEGVFILDFSKETDAWEISELEVKRKIGWWKVKPHLALSNNSAVYETKPTAEVFLTEWLALMKSGSGERGIFNREGAKKKALATGRRDADWDFGCNP